MTTTIYLLRHAMALPTAGIDNAAWLLSAEGQAQAEALVQQLQSCGLEIVVSSPYQRAVQTVTPLAQAFNLPVMTHDGLADQKLAEETLAPADFQALTREMWQNFNHVTPGGESHGACQQRVVQVMQEVGAQYADKTVLVCSHASPIALFLNTLDPGFAYDDWSNMQMPHLFKLQFDGETFLWDTGFGGLPV